CAKGGIVPGQPDYW
nr:immunoglobulin heavy chain junction region [Macaca mulatta]MOY21169.1 immunoglobulin heavy chain junction region [Macaca mulatta]MOY22390.1 immunoglobulin heavy chain junction region [Macaca mulatta]MOY23354.1 immunoglobulin heavy chain junction region [Macaca mulatta]MOY23614.1 immunoglobulin heavy chain junction region [Macaca mulatta]